MKRVALSEVKDDLSRYLRIAEKEEVVITRHGKPAGRPRQEHPTHQEGPGVSTVEYNLSD